MAKATRVFLILVAVTGIATAAPAYDLGGPCQRDDAFFSRGVQAAEKSGAWDQLVELEKANVRARCDIDYRWQKLVDALLQGGRQSEAVQVMQEMDSRGLELSPSAMLPRIEAFMDNPLFTASPLGVKIGQLRAVSDERRVRFHRLLEALPADKKPPVDYVAKGACPFECCRFGEWSVAEDTELVAAPGSTRVVGRAVKGSPALGITGEVHLKPEPIVALGGELPKNTIAFVLDYQGEGYANVYTQGKIVSVFMVYAKYCFRVSEGCSAETLLPSKDAPKPVWWVKVKLPSGLVGWTDKADHFGGQDGCS